MDQKLIVRLVLVWLVASLLITSWVALNVVVTITPFWLDTIMGLILIISLIPAMVRPSAWLREHRFGRWLSWILVGGAILLGLTYASLSFVSNRETYPFVYVLAIEQLLFRPVEQIYWAYSIGERASLSAIVQFSLFILVMGMLLLVIAGAAQIVWPALASYPSLINRLSFYRRQDGVAEISKRGVKAGI